MLRLWKNLLVLRRRVLQLAQENILVKSIRGRYKLIESVSNYITHLKANNDIKIKQMNQR